MLISENFSAPTILVFAILGAVSMTVSERVLLVDRIFLGVDQLNFS